MSKYADPQLLEIDTKEKLEEWSGDVTKWNAWGARTLGNEFEPLDPQRPVHPILKAEAAMSLWREGKEDWNAWVERNPKASIDFSRQLFKPNSKMIKGRPLFCFSSYCFPDGDISFESTKFGADPVETIGTYLDFMNAKFGDGNFNFKGVKFWGDLSFGSAEFGDGEITFVRSEFAGDFLSFSGTKFGDGGVKFQKCNFISTEVYFNKAQFGKGYIDFEKAEFSSGWASFGGVDFGEGDVSFRSTEFNECDLYFCDVRFRGGDISFFDSSFAGEVTDFDGTSFGDGDVDFREASFAPGTVTFRNCVFNGLASFQSLSDMDECSTFSFEGCSFEKLFTFSHLGEVGCPLDLRRTKLAHTVVVADIHCDYARGPHSDWSARLSNWICAVPHWPHPPSNRKRKGYFVGSPPAWKWQKKAANREDSQRFRRLKELAVANRNHAKALEFHAREIQTARGHGTSTLQDLGQFLYWIASDYGRSVKRPLGWLIAAAGVFAAIYAALRTDDKPISFSDALGPGLTFSLSQMFAFIPTGRTATEKSARDLFGAEKIADVPYEIFAIGGVQTVLSVILLFLLSLGLRNMFRV